MTSTSTPIGSNCVLKRKLESDGADDANAKAAMLSTVREFCKKYPDEALAEALKQHGVTYNSKVDDAVRKFEFHAKNRLVDDDIVELNVKIDKAESDPPEKAVVHVQVCDLPWRLQSVLKTAFERAANSNKQVGCDTPAVYTNAGALFLDTEDWESFEASYIQHLDDACSDYETPDEAEVEMKELDFKGNGDSIEHDCWLLRAETNEEAVLKSLKEDACIYFTEWQYQTRAIKIDKNQAFVRKPRVCIGVSSFD